MLLPRYYDNLEKYLKDNKALIIVGARQVGKTTLLKNFLSKTSYKYKYEFGDDIRIQNLFNSLDYKKLKEYIEGYELIAIDEAQYITNIGRAIKMIIDNIPNIKIILTGSSSFELSGQIGEPLTGRKRTIELFPIAQLELLEIMNKYELKQKLEDFLIFGSYPEVLTSKTNQEKVEILNEIVGSYLLKDILALDKIKSSKTIFELLKLLAYQIGQEVSLNEISQKLMVDVKTVKRYIDLLEKTYVIFTLTPYSRNLRNEITSKNKYYFYDVGIRNAIINNFQGFDYRNDFGNLFENFIIIERLKKIKYKKILSNLYFWRTYSGNEIDLIEERENMLFAFEIKIGEKVKLPKLFLDTYKEAKVEIITKENYLDFII